MNHETKSDPQIIALYEQRDEAAIRETEKKYGGYCFAIANGILANESDAEECVNDTWLRVWNAIPPEHPHCLKLFLAEITRNLSLDRYRERHREKRGGGEVPLALEETEELLAGTSDVESEFEQAEFMKMLNGFLYALPERECHIFIRRYFYMASTKEIAKLYGLRESHVLMILSRTRRKLREVLEREGYVL